MARERAIISNQATRVHAAGRSGPRAPRPRGGPAAARPRPPGGSPTMRSRRRTSSRGQVRTARAEPHGPASARRRASRRSVPSSVGHVTEMLPCLYYVAHLLRLSDNRMWCSARRGSRHRHPYSRRSLFNSSTRRRGSRRAAPRCLPLRMPRRPRSGSATLKLDSAVARAGRHGVRVNRFPRARGRVLPDPGGVARRRRRHDRALRRPKFSAGGKSLSARSFRI